MTPKFEKILEQFNATAQTKGLNIARIEFFENLKKIGPIERLKNLYRVENKKGIRVHFFPNIEQLRYIEERGTSHFNRILKSRQIGFTTFAAVEEYDSAIFENISSGIQANVMPNVEEIFQQKFKVIHDCFVQDWNEFLPLVMIQSSAHILRFKHIATEPPIELNTFCKVAYDFKGTTLGRLHQSEAAFMKDQRITEALQCVPHSGYATQETTPNGMGGNFYDGWQEAREGRGRFRNFFAPWFLHYPEDDDPVSGDDFVPPYNQREVEIMQVAKDVWNVVITDRAFQWRRNKIADDLGGDEKEFDRLYPSDEETCFLTGQDQVFAASLLSILFKRCKEPQNGELIGKGKVLHFEEDAAGRFLMWEKPLAGRTYVIGVDPSEGVGRDPTCAYVKDRDSGKYVAGLHGQIDVTESADCLIRLGRYYNNAHICIEVNNHGCGVIENMKKLGWTRFYRRRQIDVVSGKPTRIIGFRTSKDTKHRIIQNLKSALKEAKARIPDALFIKEASTFICDEGGKLGAKSNCHDDRIMAAALTEEMDAALPPPQDEEAFVDRIVYDPITGAPLD